MSEKYLKVYNKETGKWELVSNTDINITQVLSGDTPIRDTNVEVTCYQYADKDNPKTLDETLCEIGDDISKLQRNVSWLAEHGGGGGGGTGSSSNYGIVITSPVLTNNSVYVTGTSLTVNFTITGGTSSDNFLYRYTFDGVNPSKYKSAKVGENITIEISDIGVVSQSASHTLFIEATEESYGTYVQTSFYIYESSLSFSLNTELNEVINGEVLIPLDSEDMPIVLNVKNSILNSNTSIHYQIDTDSETYSYTNTAQTVTEQTLFLKNLLKNIGPYSLRTLKTYVQATYNVGTSVQTITTEELNIPIRIKDTSNFTIYLDGLSYETDEVKSEFQKDDSLFFSFRVYTPANITNLLIYYAVKLYSNKNPERYKWLAGSTFNDADFATNPNGVAKTSISIQTPLTNYDVKTDDNDYWIVEIKSWDASGLENTTINGAFYIIESNKEFFGRQYKKRTNQSVTADTCLFCWGATSENTDDRWISDMRRYKPTSAATPSEGVTAYIDLYNANGKNSGFIDSIPKYLRLQNEAYAVADISAFTNYVSEMYIYTGQGFDISFTFTPDTMYDNKKVALLWGMNNQNDGSLYRGIKVDLDSATWIISDDTKLIAHIRPGNKTTLDFVIDNNKNAYIYVNGVIDAFASGATFDNITVYDKIYIGCDNVNNNLTNFSDINVYELAVYTKMLSPLQIVVNSKNARLNGPKSDQEVINDYNAWMKNNLIYRKLDDETNTPLCYLISGDTYSFPGDIDSLTNLKNASVIPVLTINASNSERFTEDYFHADYGGNPSITSDKQSGTMEYYDPNTKQTVTLNIKFAIQGTSTLSYYSKNLEIYVDEYCTYDPTKLQLFQPIDTWFPENEFTLKADVIDSAHANNSTIGEWINNANIFTRNPVQNLFATEDLKASYAPKDKQTASSTTYTTHTSSIDGSVINYDEKVTVKHTLEGFPVILVILFKDGSQKGYQIMGIYSFNLGRYSYYNMGMKFLKEYARPLSTPALIDYYQEEATIGNINASDVYSYEFNAYADDNSSEHLTWSQDDISILQHYGEFKYKGTETDAIWNKLKELFSVTAVLPVGDFEGNVPQSNPFNMKYKYTYNEGFIPSATQYIADSNQMITFVQKLNVNNAAAYYIVAMAMGMVDSLGKNLTLRTWDGGETWWTCFYDMDTALALTNAGEEGVVESVYVDTYSNQYDENGVSKLVTNYYTGPSSENDTGIYNAYCSKLWAILRSTGLNYVAFNYYFPTLYQQVWADLRNRNNGSLKTYTDFIKLLDEKIGSCGELIYNFDYYDKYFENTKNSGLFHGIRIEYIREWLRKRTYFLDGVFYYKNFAGNYLDSPLNNVIFNMTSYGNANRPGATYVPFIFNTTMPTFIRINVGNAEDVPMYYLTPYKDTEIHLQSYDSEKQAAFTSSSLLTKFGGLDTCQFQSADANNSPASLSSLVNFSIAGSKTLGNNPLQKTEVFYDGNLTALESFDVSDTSFISSSSNAFTLDLSNLTKLKYINISNSPVTSINLPNSVLQTLLIKNSRITSFRMSNQPLLTGIDFSNCNKLNLISINNCKSISAVTLNGNTDINNLYNVTIENCSSLKTFNVQNINSISSITLSNNTALEEVVISACTNENLSITIVNSPSLKTIRIVRSNAVEINLPKKSELNNLTTLDLAYNYNLNSIKYGTDPAPKYIHEVEEEIVESPLIDITGLPLLSDISLKYCQSIEYLKVNNDEENPFELDANMLEKDIALTRVFGHVKLNDAGIFADMTNFFINEPVKIGGVTDFDNIPDFVDNEWYTNITIGTDSLNSMFRRTNCSLYDFYTIMQKCNPEKNGGIDVISLEACFSNSAIVISDDDRLNENSFKYCKKLKSMDNLFSGCEVTGYLSDKLLSELTELETFQSVFGAENNGYYIHQDRYFFPQTEESKLKIISFFNPYYTDLELPYYSENLAYDYKILGKLENLETISRSFNNIDIEINRPSSAPEQGIFDYCYSLKTIVDSFLNIRIVERNITNIFGIGRFTDKQYSLETISNSFKFLRPQYSSGGAGSRMIYSNDFLNGIKDTIKEINGSFLMANNENEKIIEGSFPDRIFEGCSNLEIVNSFFNGLKSDDVTEIALPGNLFNNIGVTNKIKEAASLFESTEIPIRLTSNGFAKCSITNFANIFRGCRINGMIPIKLFKQDIGNIITNMSGCFADNYGTGATSYIAPDSLFDGVVTISDAVNSELLIDGGDGYYYWNTIYFDGTSTYFNKCKAFYNNLSQEDKDLIKDNPENVKIFKDSEERGSTNESLGRGTYGDDDNRKWRDSSYFCPPDIFEYCANTYGVNIDAAFSRAGDYGIDGKLIGLYGIVPANLLWKLTEIGSINNLFDSFTSIRPYSYGELSSVTEDEHTTIIWVPGMAYSDMLFEKQTNVEIFNAIFAGTCIWKTTAIPALLFAPLNKVRTMNSLFARTFWYNPNETPYNAGYQMPFDSFDNNASLESIQNMFEGSFMFHPSNLLLKYTTNSNLHYIDKAMAECRDVYKTGTYGLPDFGDSQWKLYTYYLCYSGMSDDMLIGVTDAYKFTRV